MAISRCSKIIEDTFRRSGSLKRLKAELSVYYWPRIVGCQIAKNVVAVRYFNGYLYLKTESATLAHQLTMMNYDIMKRYRSILGNDVLRGIKINIGSIDTQKEKAESEVGAELEPNEQEFIASNCRQINDLELSNRFQALMEKAFLAKHRKQAAGSKTCLSCNVLIEADYDYCPVCELKLKDEMLCYINYLKKNQQEIDLNKLPIEINDANRRLVLKILSLGKYEINEGEK